MLHFIKNNHQITDVEFKYQLKKIVGWSDYFNNYQIELNQFKNPIKRPPDAQLHVQWKYSKNSKNRLILSWLPASHLLIDDNRNAFSESSLEIMHISSSISKDDIRLEQLTVYGISTYIPYLKHIGGISGKFKLRWMNNDDHPFKQDSRFEILGSIGLSQSLHQSTLIFSTLGASLPVNESRIWFVPEINTGIFSYPQDHSKLQAEYQLLWNDDFQSLWKQKIKLTFSYLGFKNRAFDIGLQHITNGRQNENQLNLTYRYYY